MKPIARWTIGAVSNTGFDVLRHSIVLFSKIYPEFERIVCFNSIEKSKIKFLEGKAQLFEQKEEYNVCDILPTNPNDEQQASGCGWKLCPPRLSLKTHELFIDNDLIIRKRIKEIDDWLKVQDEAIMSEGHPRSRMFGVFDEFIPKEINVCAGLFGLPPNFDFADRIKFFVSQKKVTIGGWEEQGLTASIVTNSQKYRLIPLSKVHISEDWVEDPLAPLSQNYSNNNKQKPDAIHFVGANRKPWHRGWCLYLNNCIKNL